MLLKKTPLGTMAYLGGLMSLPEKFCWAWGQMVQYNNEYLCAPGEYVHLDRATVSLHSYARNSLAERFFGDWLIMFDTDHAPAPDTVVRLVTRLVQYEIDVVVGVYRHRAGPGSPVLYQWSEDGKTSLPIADWDRTVSLIKIGSAGAGCLLVKRSVFDRITNELKEAPFSIDPPFGEDHSFFMRLKRLGIPAYAAVTVEAPHLEIRELPMSEYHPTDLMRGPMLEVEGFR